MTQKIIDDLIELLNQMKDTDYTKKINRLNHSTIGQHVRHSIEMYQLIINQSDKNEVDYSNRNRDIVIETSTKYAIDCLQKIQEEVVQKDRILYVKNNEEEVAVLSSYNREIVYCAEHLIHHMALIKVALQETAPYTITNAFGVAPSTLKYRKQCAQ